MFGLALHTSTPELGLAISDFDTLHRHQTWALGRDLSSQLHVLLQEFMPPQHWQDLGFIAACIGPGGFTGTRIGVATARTLAQQLNIPLFGISALAAVAHHTMAAGPANQATDIAITMPAKRGAVYGAIYHWTGSALISTLADSVLPASDWEQKQTQWPKPLQEISLESGVGLAETTISLLQLGHNHWQQGSPPDWREVTPFYGQHPVNT
ncbi:MAG: tRNA (adenosine(37)-N6)-threonylcarbamoyltransferase complex dimerization subunit type 1 TsaB [Cyanobacteria bacterium P01_B01_bin.77]